MFLESIFTEVSKTNQLSKKKQFWLSDECEKNHFQRTSLPSDCFRIDVQVSESRLFVIGQLVWVRFVDTEFLQSSDLQIVIFNLKQICYHFGIAFLGQVLCQELN